MVVSTTWQHFQVRFSEWFAAITLFGWGVYLIIHPGMMLDPRVASLWTGMVAIMPQETWGLAAVLTGACRLAALYVNGHHSRTPLIRLIASFFSAFVWTQVSVGLWKAGVPNTGVWLYPCLVAADIYSAFRASGDVTLVSKRLRESEESGGGSGSSKART